MTDLLERSPKRDRDVAEGVDNVRAAQVPGDSRRERLELILGLNRIANLLKS